MCEKNKKNHLISKQVVKDLFILRYYLNVCMLTMYEMYKNSQRKTN